MGEYYPLGGTSVSLAVEWLAVLREDGDCDYLRVRQEQAMGPKHIREISMIERDDGIRFLRWQPEGSYSCLRGGWQSHTQPLRWYLAEGSIVDIFL